MVLTVGLVAVAHPASAHYRPHGDPKDAPNGFDIARVRLRTNDGDLIGKVQFYDVESGYWDFDLLVGFDGRGDDRRDGFAAILWRIDAQGLLEAGFYQRGRGLVGDVKVRTDDSENVVRFRFPKRFLRATRDVRWKVTIDSFDQKDFEGEADRAPDAGWFDH